MKAYVSNVSLIFCERASQNATLAHFLFFLTLRAAKVKIMDTNFKPSQVTQWMWNSPWRNNECETVAINIKKLCQFSKGDQGSSFTWEDYTGFCSHDVKESERAILNKFVSQGYLSFDGAAYSFTDKILGVYLMYI